MIYLIGQLSIWLLLTAAFAAVAGWAFAAERAAAADSAAKRDREKLLRDIIRLASGHDDGVDTTLETERETDANRRLIEIRDARIAELEQQTQAARARADDAVGEIAELQRRLVHGDDDAEEITRLRALVAQHEARPTDAEDAVIEEPDNAEAIALQAWRLRYFEQRVRYLETLARAAPAPGPEEPTNTLSLEWRARDAEARADHLEQELRSVSAPPSAPEPAAETADIEPFASDADVDVLLRWRLLYLERRVSYLQQEQSGEEVAPTPSFALADEPDPDRWKWRARYLEARVRHLEQRPLAPRTPMSMAAAVDTDVDELEPPAPAASSSRGVKPPVLPAARDGAPDDLRLIDGVSAMQQTTLYSLGIFHFDQVAAWTPDNVAWVDNYLRLRGRIDEEEWVEQAVELARDGPAAARSFDEEE